jgi:diadenosine tetraphosphate (Ap4A) HIT family hydrolase/phosphohistidine swiveling domain-containing protein
MSSTELSGTAASPGVATGPAAVVVDGGVQRGAAREDPYVLVAHLTTPDLTPALVDAAAIVTDEGGIASHAANIARELGIPCVVSTHFASLRINPGDIVNVDGSAGKVVVEPQPGCLLCNRDPALSVLSSDLLFGIYDGFPVRAGHLLIAPRRHVEQLDEFSVEEFVELRDLFARGRSLLTREWGATGMNVGLNEGAVAGQTLAHLHWHLIPREAGDASDPRGGIRNFLPDPLAPYPPADNA